jgi:molybdenum cofactor cytidylyltransferase
MKSGRFAVIILAGGLSTRMKQFKPLMPLGKGTVLDHVISTFKSADIDVLLVVGYRRDTIESSLKNRDITIIYNPDYEKGMFTSVQAGVRGLKPGYRYFFILPADIPLVTKETIKNLMDTAIKNPGKIIYPVFKGKRGHPPLIPSAIATEISAEKKDSNLKSVLKTHGDISMEVLVDDKFILFDIDTPDDYQAMLTHYQHH